MEDTDTDTQMPGKEWGLHGGQAAASLHRASHRGPALGRHPARNAESTGQPNPAWPLAVHSGNCINDSSHYGG